MLLVMDPAPRSAPATNRRSIMRKVGIFALGAVLAAGAIAVAAEHGMHGRSGMHAMGGTHEMHMRHGGPGMMGGADRHLEWLSDELELTAEQQNAAKALHKGVRDEVEAIFDQQRDIHEAIGDMLDSANPDPAALGQKMIEGHALHAKMEAIHDKLRSEFKVLLTPEQQKKFEAIESDRMKMRHGPMGDRGEE
jgi:Spy/CpxP family protein refolding chaperone